jgi:glycosyltransferase involved in cell wall biosynthesis
MTAMRLSQEKNATFIIDIAAAMNPLAQDFVFLIAGNGPLKGDLEKKAKVAGLEDKILFLGYIADMNELLDVTDIFILPTLRELHSISMIEAMSRRVPVLVTRSAGCNGYLISDGLNGFLLDPKEPRQWASTIEDLIANEEKRRFVGEKGRELVEKDCDIHKTAKKFEELYFSLIKQC